MTALPDGVHTRGSIERRVWPQATLFARIVLAAGFLSAVADRFGVWGPSGSGNVAWGDFDSFVGYTQSLAPYLGSQVTTVVAWLATAIEIVLGCALVAGIALRWTALVSGITLVSFAVSMGAFSGVQTVFNASVLSAAAAAFLLALAPVGSYVFSLDNRRRNRDCRKLS